MYEHVVAEATATDGTPFRVILEPDTATGNPRDDYSNAGVIHVRTHSQYNGLREFDTAPGQLDRAIDCYDFRVVARWLQMFHGASVVLPLYSSGGNDFNISAGSAGETPEAGNYVGVTFDTPDSTQFIGATMDIIAAALAADVETYHAWVEGDTWFHVVQEGEVDEDGEVTDWGPSGDMEAVCGGFIGQQWAEEAAQEALDSVVANYDDEVAQRIAQAADDEDELAGMAEARI